MACKYRRNNLTRFFLKRFLESKWRFFDRELGKGFKVVFCSFESVFLYGLYFFFHIDIYLYIAYNNR